MSSLVNYSDSKGKRSWTSGRGVTIGLLSECRAPAGRVNPLAMVGVGRGAGRVVTSGEVVVLPDGEIILQQEEAKESRLVREEAAGEFPVADPKRLERSPVREVPMVASKEPMVFRERSRSREVCPETTLQAKWRCGGPIGEEGLPRQSTPSAWLWSLDPEDEGPCLQVSSLPVF